MVGMTMNRSVRQKFHAGQLTGKVSTLVTTDSGSIFYAIFLHNYTVERQTSSTAYTQGNRMNDAVVDV